MRTDEGIEITNQALACFIAVLFLGLFTYVYAYNYRIQKRFEVEQNEIKANTEYAKVAAYDGSIINGQDVVGFITKYRGEIPVILSHGGTHIVYCAYVDDYTALQHSTDYKVYRLRDDSKSVEDQYEEVTLSSLDGGASGDNLRRYQVLNPDGTPKYDAATLITKIQDDVKLFRHDALGKTDGIYGNWKSKLYYDDHSCRNPAVLIVEPES